MMDTEEKLDKKANETNETNEDFLNEIILKSSQYSPSKIIKVSNSRKAKLVSKIRDGK